MTGDARPTTPGAPLAGWRVLVPRGGHWGERVASLLRAAGAEPVVLPLIAFAHPADPQGLEDAAARLAAGGYDWVVFTSATAVTALAEAMATAEDRLGESDASGATNGQGPEAANGHEPDAQSGARRLRLPVGLRVAAVGAPTAAALAAAGASVDFVPSDDFSARALVEEWPDRTPGARVLAPLSELAAPTLVDGLRAHGLAVDAVGAYTTVTARPAADALAAAMVGGIRAVLVTSGSVARALVELLPELPVSTVMACIGERTADEARAAGLRVDVVAGIQTVDALVDALARYAASAADGTHAAADAAASAPAPGRSPAADPVPATDPVEPAR